MTTMWAAIASFGKEKVGPIFLAAGLIATWVGVRQYAVLDEFPRDAAKTLLMIAVAVWVLAAAVRGALELSAATVIALIWVVALTFAVGISAVVSTGLLVAAAMGLGWKLVPSSVPARALLALVSGLGLISGVLGWLLAFPIHTRGLYLLGLALIIGLTRKELREAIESIRHSWRDIAADSPAAFGVLIVGLAGTSAWLPTIMFDDLVYHLGLPMQLLHLEYYRLDPASQLWSLAPWATDVIHAIPVVLSRDEARGAVNLVWLSTCAALVGVFAHSLGVSRTQSWLAAALFASLPLSGVLVLSMQTELPSAAAALALALTIRHAPDAPDRRTLFFAAVLSAFLMALKTSNALTILVLGVWLIFRWRGQLPWRHLPLAVLVGVVLGGASYFFAGWLAGNPVLPLYNDLFGSEYARPSRFSDSRWDEPVHWNLFWMLTFEVREFYSGRAGATGFVWVALMGGAVLALFDRRLRAPAIVALAVAILPLVFAPYMRYAFPGFALLIPVLVAGFVSFGLKRALTGAVVGLIAFQLAMAPNGSYIFANAVVEQWVERGKGSVLEKYAPERSIAQWIHDTHQDSARVFLADPGRPYTAPFAGQAFAWAWYDRDLQERVLAFDDGDRAENWRAFWAEYGFTHILVYGDDDDDLNRALSDATRVLSVGRAELWRLPNPGSRNLVEERDYARQLRGASGP
jgi:hypothetical protein